MKRVVIIGGGFAGAYAAKRLQKTFAVTLIDHKEYFEFTPSILRAIVQPSKLGSIQVRHKDYLQSTAVVVGEVTGITKKQVLVGKQSFAYDYLIIGSGSSYASPIKDPDAVLAMRGKHLHEAYNKTATAKRLLVIGGGLVGVELAAELIEHYPHKEITLVHSRAELLERNLPKTRQYAARFLSSRGVKLILGERVMKSAKGLSVTDHGTTIRSDVTFLCTGIIPNTSFVDKKLGILDEKGRVKVNTHMQAGGLLHIFAPGDVNDIPIEKTAQNATEQAHVACENILRMERGNELLAYESTKTPLCISLGKWSGVLEISRFALCGIIPAALKYAIEVKEMITLKFL